MIDSCMKLGSRRLTLLCVLLLAGPALQAHAVQRECSAAVVVSSPSASLQEHEALRMLHDEVQSRTGLDWHSQNALTPSPCSIVAGTRDELRGLLPPTLLSKTASLSGKPESFLITAEQWHGHTMVLIAGADPRGVLFGAGALLRKLRMERDHAVFAAPLYLAMTPEKAIRSHQIGYRSKNNTYDAWNLGQFEQQIRDLAIFGSNTIQLIAPHSDDAESSPLSPAPALETVVGISSILARYGLNCDLYYPEMESDYSRSEDTDRELQRFRELVRQMPRINALWIPGGDPGHTRPQLLFQLAAQQAAILAQYHPSARVYLSAQGMDAAQMEEFYQLVATQPAWLTGIFFGPQSRDSFETQRRRIPTAIPMIFYPDIAHTMHAQFPVPEWDPVFAVVEGREPIDPRPVDEAIIYRHFAAMHQGFVTYSEGVNDDVNKMLWSAWGWDAALPANQILQDYARLYAGPRVEVAFAQGLLALEQNWRGPLTTNPSILPTLRAFQQMEAQLPQKSWRVEIALYRAYYDAYLQQRLLAESSNEQAALGQLALAPTLSAQLAVGRARAELDKPLPADVLMLRSHVFTLADELFHHVGLQLSVKLYGASNWERGANLDRIDLPLNDRIWLEKQFAKILALPSAQQSDALALLLHRSDMPAGGFYDDLGQPWMEPHLVRGPSYAVDPEMYQRAIDGVADRTPEDGWRWSELTYAEALYETPLALHYEKLDPKKLYRLRVLYAGEDYALPLRLIANNQLELQSYKQRSMNRQVVEYDLPATATNSGSLLLEWFRPAGIGGGGRGRQLAEVTLFVR